jgi:Ni/Fe-hydrogenase subunit HybB-like protein
MAATASAPRQHKIFTTPFILWVASLTAVFIVGLVGMITVLTQGLEVTGLTDQVPWGLWITLDLSAIALGAGAFSFSAAVYLFRIKSLEPMARPAVFIGFLGYTSAMLALAMDIGRPDRFYHPLIYWNVHSVLWEITWCVILYSTVLILEVLPLVFDSHFFDRWPKLRQLGHTIHKATPVFAVLGMALSLLHQSSLGATYGVLSGRAIWYKPSLPIMFIISAVAGGMAMTLVATLVTGQIRHMKLLPRRTIEIVLRIIGVILLGYLYIKMWDWAATTYYSVSPGTADALSRLRATTPYTTTFWGLEILLGGLIPAIIIFVPQLRKNIWVLIFALTMIPMGVVVNRWNVTLSGLVVPPDWSPGIYGNTIAARYLPTTIEVMVAAGIFAYAWLGYTLGVRFLPIFGKPLPKERLITD